MVTRLTDELIEEYTGGEFAPQKIKLHTEGTVMVPPEYIGRLLDDISGPRHTSTKTGWIKNIQLGIERQRGSPLGLKSKSKKTLKPIELVGFNIEDYYALQDEILDILESKQTAEAMNWTKAAAIARFLDKSGINTTKRFWNKKTELLTTGRMDKAFSVMESTKLTWDGEKQTKRTFPTPNTTVGKGDRTL